MEATWMSASGDPRQFDPFRAPDWRWRRATELLLAGRRPLDWEDPAVGRARIFQRDLALHADSKGGWKRHPDLTAAHNLYRQGGISRNEVEARLLAGESAAVIASKACVSVEAVVAYEAYFFNVAHCLNAHDWLMTQAVFPGPGLAVEERHVWRYWGLAGGSAMVDVLVADYVGGSRRPATSTSSSQAEKARYLMRDFCAGSSSPKEMEAMLKEGYRLFDVGSKAFRQRCKNDSATYETFRLNLRFLRTVRGVRSSARSPRTLQSSTQVLAQAASRFTKTEKAKKVVAERSVATKQDSSEAKSESAILANGAKEQVHHALGAGPQLGTERQAALRPPEIWPRESSLTVITRLAEQLRKGAAMEASRTAAEGIADMAATTDDAVAGDAASNGTGTANTYVPAAAA